MSYKGTSKAKCKVCGLFKNLTIGRRICSSCAGKHRIQNGESRRVGSLYSYEGIAIHNGGESNCGCDICYLRHQPLIAFQVGWLGEQMLLGNVDVGVGAE
jgi:hypothetical protein